MKWSARDTARALRGARAGVLREWQADAQYRLWHLEKSLFTRKGQATGTADKTLIALAEYNQARSEHVADTELPSDRVDPDAGSEDAEAPDATSEADARHFEPTGNLSGFLDFGLPGALTAQAAACADGWFALPLPWPDVRALLEMLIAHTSRALQERGSDADALAINNGFFTAVATLICDRRVVQLEQQLADNREEAATTQHLAARFLANASHELRTPLTAILGFAELLLEETYGELTGDQRTAVSHVENSAQNLLEVVNNLLDLLRIRSGKLALHYRPVAMPTVLHNLYAILLPLAGRKNVGFTMELSDDLGYIEADENIFRHIVYHLLASALRATPSGGSVVLRATREGDWLTILTHDTALHLPPEAIAVMQDPFPRLENSPARGYEGWEVGLPLVRRYVELHEGMLDLESEPGHGTTFRLKFPISHNAQKA